MLRKATANDPERLSTLLKALVGSVEESLNDIRESLAQRDQQLLGQSVHRLKGTLAMSGAANMAEHCCRCLDLIKQSGEWNEVEQISQELDETLRNSLADLHR